ncbi:HAD family hydrolase [Halorubrum sp. DTA98]|uniref:HAD family hydrolase n=1 Tax=Halorubrum sp. DTA98 TaxID=3402163 RepID=UPI003AAFCACB
MTFDPSEYDAVVYDLDGTLVDLAVDWDAVADDVIAVYTDNAIKPPGDGLWDLLGAADQYGIRADVEAVIGSHERVGARESTRLPLADVLAAGDPTRAAVCSLNCEDACRVALETHDVDDAVSAVVGRDTVDTHKPDPESLLAAVDALGVDAANAVFVGDSARDATTAERAGVPFVWTADVTQE